MARISIDKERGPRETRQETMPLEKIRLDPENVRFRHVNQILSDAEIEARIWEEDDTRDLYRSIVASGGLSERPYVMPDGVVKEGNRRVACLRKARALQMEGKLDGALPDDAFDPVEVEVFDEGISPEELDIWLARIHVTGKKEWDALNQADHLWRLHNERGLSYERIRDLLGMGKAEVIRKVDSYMATKEYLRETNDSDIRKYSFFDELYKKRPLRRLFDGDPVFREDIFRWILEGKFDVTGAKDMRDLISVLNDKDAKAAFQERGMRAAMFELQKNNPALGSPTFRAITSALDALKLMPREEVRALAEKSRHLELLQDLRSELDGVLEDAGVGS